MIIKRIKKSVTHQGIGGQEFIVDEYITKTLEAPGIIEKALTGNPACFNFMLRRPDFSYGFPHKLYYGKVGGLGYVVAEDEFVEEGE